MNLIKPNQVNKANDLYKMRGVLVGIDEKGNKHIVENEVILPGRRFALATLFGKAIPIDDLITLDMILKEQIGKHGRTNYEPRRYTKFTSEYTDAAALTARTVCLVGVGLGGSGDMWGSVRDPNANNMCLMEPIPMRCHLNNTGGGVDDELYGFKAIEELNVINGSSTSTQIVNSRYLKKVTSVDLTLESNATKYKYHEGDNAKTDSGELSNSVIQSYATISFEISTKDIKEFFKLTHGNIANARFNELGLFLGLEVTKDVNGIEVTDYVGVECFSRLSFNNKGMETDGSFYKYVYYLVD